MLDLSIVIVNWNVCDLLRACLKSIEHTTSLDANGDTAALLTETIVVDCESTDGSTAMIRQEYSWVNLIEAGANLGFSAGNNRGIEASQGRFVLLLNPDTVLCDGALHRVTDYLDNNENIGVVGPKLLNEDGTTQSSRRRFPTLATAIFESTWLERLAPRGLLQRYYFQDVDDAQTVDVDWLTGAALLVRREVIEQVGGFDPGFFMYSEEVDWQKRIKNAGWRIVYLADAQIVHYGGKSSEQVAPLRHIRFQTSKVRYFRKHHGFASALIVRIVILSNYVWQIGLEGMKWLLGHRRTLRRERIDAYLQVLRSGLRSS